jgi:hypothetical protein
MEREDLADEELEAVAGTPLPPREAMTILNTTSLSGGYQGLVPGPSGAGGADSGTTAADGATHLIDADAAGHDTTPIATEGDTTTVVNNSDSASAG